jgi:EAL domain-containing protein (putative c-di-GMP-specific phosphodiesterase class I)
LLTRLKAPNAVAIVPLGEWVLEACRQLRIWEEKFDFDRPLIMSVNLSGL